jgi:hypothetical protein
MTVDSGADVTTIPYGIGRALRMRRQARKTRRLAGVAGGLPYLLVPLRMEIGNVALDVRVARAMRDDVPALLGRLDVFDRFTITFDGRSFLRWEACMNCDERPVWRSLIS